MWLSHCQSDNGSQSQCYNWSTYFWRAATTAGSFVIIATVLVPTVIIATVLVSTVAITVFSKQYSVQITFADNIVVVHSSQVCTGRRECWSNLKYQIRVCSCSLGRTGGCETSFLDRCQNCQHNSLKPIPSVLNPSASYLARKDSIHESPGGKWT